MKKKQVPVEVGKTYTVDIEDYTATGEGVAKIDGFTVFIDNAVVGEKDLIKITQLKTQYAKAELVRIIQDSDKKSISPPCSKATICGGCPYMPLIYTAQLEQKEKQVKDALERIGGFKDLPIEPIIGGEPLGYRNKAQFKVSDSGVGFYKKGTHEIVPLDSCALQSEITNQLIPKLNALIKEFNLSEYNENTHTGLLKGILIRSNVDNEVLIVFILNGDKLPHQDKILQKLKEEKSIVGIYININKNKTNTILGKETKCLYKRKDLVETIGTKKFTISPTSFFQVNSKQTEKLYQLVKDLAKIEPNEVIYDLYCGTGTIGIYIANEETQLKGIEINPNAVEDARRNAKLNNLTNAEFLAGKAEVITKNLESKPDCIILDPPRKGCDKRLLELLLELKAKRIVYISCNPSTLARDLKVLSNEYSIKEVVPVDLFPQTGHVETITLLELKEKDD